MNRPVVRNGLPYPPACPADFQLYDDAPAGCVRLKAAGFLLVVATNQPDVGRGTQSRAVVEAMHEILRAALPIDRVEVCYHSGKEPADARCACRKPAPGMLQRAAEALSIDLARSYMIGDRWRDIDCGRAAGCRTIFLDRGYREALRQPPDWTAHSFAEAVDIILSETGESPSSR